jgi:hypothetical protein
MILNEVYTGVVKAVPVRVDGGAKGSHLLVQ